MYLGGFIKTHLLNKIIFRLVQYGVYVWVPTMLENKVNTNLSNKFTKF